MADHDLYLVDSNQVVPADPECSPCAVIRRKVAWPYPANEQTVNLKEYTAAELAKPAPVWTADTSYPQGGWVTPTDTNANPYIYQTSLGGTSGATEPNWPGFSGSTGDGSIYWIAIQRAGRLVLDAVARVIEKQYEPAPEFVYDFQIFLKVEEILGTLCPLVSQFQLYGDGGAPDANQYGDGSTDIYLEFHHDGLAFDMLTNPSLYSIVMDGVTLDESTENPGVSTDWWHTRTTSSYEWLSINIDNGTAWKNSLFFFNPAPITSVTHNLKILKQGVIVSETDFTFDTTVSPITLKQYLISGDYWGLVERDDDFIFEVYADGGAEKCYPDIAGVTGCPVASWLALTGDVDRPVLADNSGEDYGLVFIATYSLDATLAAEFIAAPLDFDFVFDGHENTVKGYNAGSAVYIFTDDSSQGGGDSDGAEYSEFFFYPFHPQNNYFYVYVPTDNLTGSFTLAVKKNGVAHSSIVFNYTIPYLPSAGQQVVPDIVVLQDVVGPFFGQIEASAMQTYRCGYPYMHHTQTGTRPIVEMSGPGFGFIAEFNFAAASEPNFIDNPDDFTFVFNGHAQTEKDSTGLSPRYWGYVNPNDSQVASGFYHYVLKPNDGFSYIYIELPTVGLTGSFTMEVKYQGAPHSSCTYNYTIPAIPADIFDGQVCTSVVMTNIVGTFFGGIADGAEVIWSTG